MDSASEAGGAYLGDAMHLKKLLENVEAFNIKNPQRHGGLDGWFRWCFLDFTWVIFRVNQSLIVRGVDEDGILKCLINYSTIPRKTLLVDIHGLCPC